MDTRQYLQILNLNPDGKDTADCSTRSLAYCLNEDYSKLRKLQDDLSLLLTGSRSNWNSHAVFEPILMSRNWRKILFLRNIPRYKLAKTLMGKVRIFTESYAHVAPIYNGKVMDTWDSTRGRVSSIFVPDRYLSQVCLRLEKNDIGYLLD